MGIDMVCGCIDRIGWRRRALRLQGRRIGRADREA
jgi:hypothetical protein